MGKYKVYSRRRGVANTVGILFVLATLSVATTILVFNSGILNTINTEIEENDTSLISDKIVTNIDNGTLTESNTTTTNPENNKPDLNETKQVTYYQLIIEDLEGSGASSPEPGVYEYPEGDRVSISITPSEGWRIDHLIIDGHDFQNLTTEIIMNQTHTVNITFSKITFNLTIETEGSGNTDPPTGTQSYFDGTIVQVYAEASSEWIFDHWNLDEEIEYDNPIQVLVDSNHVLKAVFSGIPVPIPPTPVPTSYTLSLQTEGYGSTNLGSGIFTYNEMEATQVLAIPSNGWEFDHWVLDGANIGNSNPIAINMDSPHSLKAVFTLITQDSYSLTVKTVGQGSILKNPSQSAYSNGRIVQLTATSSTGWVFAGWSGDIKSTANPLSIIMNGNMTVTATFVKQQYHLTIIKSGTGSGTVNKNPNSETYAHGTPVTITATPETGSIFAGWSGGITSTANPLHITMNGNMTVTATFVKQQYRLTVNKAGDGSGSVNKNPSATSYTYGTKVTLTATPETGSIFAGWSGDITGTNNPLSITMNANVTVTATFVKQQYSLNVNKVGTGGGSVSKNPNLETYAFGSSVTLTATPEIGSIFAGWSDDLSGTANPASITISSSKTVTARFTRISPELTILSPEGYGTTSLSIGGHTYNYGYSVQITATPADGEIFDHWELDGLTEVSDNPITLTMTSDHTLKAIFTQTEALGIFSDSSCNMPLTNLSWGTLSPDTVIYKFIYIKNLSSQSITLQCNYTCTPEDAANHITITWDRENVVLAPNASIQATLTLEVGDDIHDVTDFNIAIEIIGNLP